MHIKKSDVKLKKHKKSSHKGDNGRLLIIGGSIDYVGALILAGSAAFAAGVDIVTIAAPSKVSWAINCFDPNFITKKYKGDYFKATQAKQVIKLSKQFDAILIGNGLGERKTSLSFAKKVCKINKPKVVDADALKAIELQEINNAILTPHKKELETLLKNSKLKQSQIKTKIGSNVLLIKSKTDKIISKNKTIYNKTGNEGMTTGGTGDVLAGLCAGFLAQKYPLLKSATYSAFINGYTGDLIYKQKGVALTASDIVETLPYTIKRFY